MLDGTHQVVEGITQLFAKLVGVAHRERDLLCLTLVGYIIFVPAARAASHSERANISDSRKSRSSRRRAQRTPFALGHEEVWGSVAVQM